MVQYFINDEWLSSVVSCSSVVPCMTGEWERDIWRTSRAIWWAFPEWHWCLWQLFQISHTPYMLLIILGFRKRVLQRLQQEELCWDEAGPLWRVLHGDGWNARETPGRGEQPEKECKEKPEVACDREPWPSSSRICAAIITIWGRSLAYSDLQMFIEDANLQRQWLDSCGGVGLMRR